jgi:thioredoxin reductase
MKTTASLPVAIIGAGPVGLAAAAQLTVRKQPFIIFESGRTVASNILSWKHIRVFSPWRYNIDKAARQLLEQTTWTSPDDEALPTGQQLFDLYFKPLSELPDIKPHLLLQAKVIAIGRTGLDKMKTAGRDNLPYTVQVLYEGHVRQFQAKAIIDTSGTWNSPNPIGSGGAFAAGEMENKDKIFYGIPNILHEDQNRYKNKNVLVVGSGHSAINAILELDKLKDQFPDTQIHWVLRKKHISDVYGGQENDALQARGALGIKIKHLVNENRVHVHTPVQVLQLVNTGTSLSVIGMRHGHELALSGIDQIISNTGSRPDFSFLREVRLNIDPSLESAAGIAELIDPNIHSCGTVRPHGENELRHPDKDFYIAGSKSYGRAPTFLMATGYEQVRSIAAAIDGDFEAAQNVELDLPETGVCSVSQGCCTPSRSVEENNGACCAQPTDGSLCCNK